MSQTEESDIKLTAAVNLSGVGFLFAQDCGAVWNKPGTEKMSRCRRAACLKMLKLWQQKKLICTHDDYGITLIMQCNTIVIARSAWKWGSCCDIVHAIQMHIVSGDWRVCFPPPLVNPFVWASVSIAAAAGSGANHPGRASDEWEVSACLQSTHRSMACRGNAHYPRTDTTHSMCRGAP